MSPARPPGDAAAVRLATVYCETCGRETPHRILRLDPRRSPGTLAGTARCQECRVTAPFLSSLPPAASLDAIVSAGPRSERHRLDLEADRVLRRGDRIELAGRAALVTRLEDRRHRDVGEARAADLATVWATRSVEPTVRVALIEGARSRTLRVPSSAFPGLEVGGRFRLGNSALVIAALRARGRTWRRPGDAFRAEEVSVVYARRAESPPAGRRRWSSVREMPSSRTISSSSRARSRSSPGASR